MKLRVLLVSSLFVNVGLVFADAAEDAVTGTVDDAFFPDWEGDDQAGTRAEGDPTENYGGVDYTDAGGHAYFDQRLISGTVSVSGPVGQQDTTFGSSVNNVRNLGGVGGNGHHAFLQTEVHAVVGPWQDLNGDGVIGTWVEDSGGTDGCSDVFDCGNVNDPNAYDPAASNGEFTPQCGTRATDAVNVPSYYATLTPSPSWETGVYVLTDRDVAGSANDPMVDDGRFASNPYDDVALDAAGLDANNDPSRLNYYPPGDATPIVLHVVCNGGFYTSYERLLFPAPSLDYAITLTGSVALGGETRTDTDIYPDLQGQDEVPLQPGRWSLNVMSVPDALPQGRLRWDGAVGLVDPTDPDGPCLLQPTRASTGIVPLDFYYQDARVGSNGPDIAVPLLSAPQTCGGSFRQRSGPETLQQAGGSPDEVRLGSYLNLFATVGAGSGSDETSTAPTGAVSIVPSSIRWVVQRCTTSGTAFAPGSPGAFGVPMSRGMSSCAQTGDAVDLSRHVSPDTGTGGAGTAFQPPRLGELFPAGSGSSWALSCLRLDAVEHREDGDVSYPGLMAHDWFFLSDPQAADATGHDVGLDPRNWYDLSGDNGCPIQFPAAPLPEPLACGRSEFKVTGAPSTSPDADYDGPVEIRLKVGDNRQLTLDRMDAGDLFVQTHDVDPATQTYSWHLDTLDAGVYKVHYTAETACPLPNVGGSESWDVTLYLHKAGSKCVSQGNTVTGPTARFAVGFHALPGGMTVGSSYNTGTVAEVVPSLRLAAVSVPAATFAAFVQATSGDRNVDYCEIDGIGSFSFTPDDPGYAAQYGPAQIHAPGAWDTTLGTDAKSVCIVDSGVRYTHPDIAAHWLGGYDFVDDDADPDDEVGHGTHVAGIAAATINNGIGIAGIAQVGIKAVRVAVSTGASEVTVAHGIAWCADNGGDVINVSICFKNPSNALASAVAYATSTHFGDTPGKVLVASAGNVETCKPTVGYPAWYGGAIAVSATDSTETFDTRTSQGPEVDLAAPGIDILSTAAAGFPSAGCGGDGSDYAWCSGTSMAAPHVAGAAALIWSYVPDLTNTQVRHYLECRAKDKGVPGDDGEYGKGLLQLKESLDAAIAGTCDPTACVGAIRLDGAAPGSAYTGPTTMTFRHSAATAHPTSVTATASDGTYVRVEPAGHDEWIVYAGDHNTRRVTVTIVTSCGTFHASWIQYN